MQPKQLASNRDEEWATAFWSDHFFLTPQPQICCVTLPFFKEVIQFLVFVRIVVMRPGLIKNLILMLKCEKSFDLFSPDTLWGASHTFGNNINENLKYD